MRDLEFRRTQSCPRSPRNTRPPASADHPWPARPKRSTGWAPKWRSRSFRPPDQPDMLVVEGAQRGPTLGRTKCANTIIRRGRKAWTGFCGISQQPIKDFAVLEDEFADQRLCLGSSDLTSPKQPCSGVTATWTDRHPGCWPTTSTTPARAQLVDHGDDAIDDRYGRWSPAARAKRGSSTSSVASARWRCLQPRPQHWPPASTPTHRARQRSQAHAAIDRTPALLGI